MSTKKYYSAEQVLWFKAIHRVICNIRSEQLQAHLSFESPSETTSYHLRWRIAYNYYRAGDYDDALRMLSTFSMLTNNSSGSSSENTQYVTDNYYNQKSFINEVTGRFYHFIFFYCLYTWYVLDSYTFV